MYKRQRIESGEDMQKKTFSINLASLYYLEMGMGESCAFNQLDIAATLTSSPAHQNLCRCFSRYKINSFFLQINLADANIDFDEDMQCTLFTIYDSPSMFANMNFSKIASHDTYKGTNVPINGKNADAHIRNITVKFGKFSNSYKCSNVGNVIYGIKMRELTDEDFKIKLSINLKLSVTYGGVRDAADLILTYIDPHRIVPVNGSSSPPEDMSLCNKIICYKNNNEFFEVPLNFTYNETASYFTPTERSMLILAKNNATNMPIGKLRNIIVNYLNPDAMAQLTQDYWSMHFTVPENYYRVVFYHNDTPILRVNDPASGTTFGEAFVRMNFSFIDVKL